MTATSLRSTRDEVEARLGLAYLLADRGRPEQALDELNRVLRALPDAPGHARALAQRGGVLLDLGRHAEALDHYREALPALRAAGDGFWVRRVIWNRGLAHAYRHEFAAAEADLRQAELLVGGEPVFGTPRWPRIRYV